MEEKTKVAETVDETELLDPDDFDEEEPKEGDDKPDEGDDEAKESSEPSEQSAEEKEKQRRAEFAKRRREKEAAERARREREENEARIRKEATEKAELGIITKNPYTGKPIKDANDLEVFKIQKEIDERGGDPIADLAEEIAERGRKAQAERARQDEETGKAEKEQREQIDELRRAYPKINTAELADDPDFMEVAAEKGGRWSVLEIYEESLRRKQSHRSDENGARAEAIAKKQKQPAASGGAKTSSEKPVESMTKEEFEAYWRKKYHA